MKRNSLNKTELTEMVSRLESEIDFSQKKAKEHQQAGELRLLGYYEGRAQAYQNIITSLWVITSAPRKEGK